MEEKIFNHQNQAPLPSGGVGGGSFDKIVERRGTGCVKWDAEFPFGIDDSEREGLIPLWVADMDFEVAPAIREALQKRVEHGVFGYTTVQNSYYEAVVRWFERRHNWTIQREWIQYTTGVVPAISAVIKALTMPGERVLILTPVYNCFFSSIRNNGCEVVESPLVVRSSGVQEFRSSENPSSLLVPPSSIYEVNWSDFELKCADEKTTVFLLCNPHNPAGRVWTREELQRMNEICLRHHVRVVSDEIHCELVMPGHHFTPFGTVNPATDATAPIICSSPSKSFNIAGLQMANIICADPETRRRIDRAININEICDVNPFAPLAVEAAYNEGEAWLDALNEYIFGNYQALCEFFAKNLPQLKVFQLEGTYLAWIDIAATGLSADEFEEKLLREAHVWVNSGTMYGTDGYIRINLATQRSRLMEGLRRIEKFLNR
ncbi:MAG: pyridoxal phosphate-dependent aminotransferase [Prevotella sp.]|nr:pyridoxal phosphate-dependent aminotransferase [Prevotella sp.]